MVSLLLIAGCKVGPNYSEPKLDVPASFGDATAAASTQPAVGVETWWKTLNDPTLDRLVERAIQSNLDLREAIYRLREARAARTAAGADLFPVIDATGSYQHSRRSENATPGPSPEGAFKRQAAGVIGGGLAQAASGGGGTLGPGTIVSGIGNGLRQLSQNGPSIAPPLEQDLFQGGFDMSWEIDVFGGTRRATEAADADIDAALNNVHTVRVSLVAEVARNYTELRGAQRRLEIAVQNIKAQRESVELARTRFEAGLTGELDVKQAEAQLALTESQVPRIETSVAQAIHRLGVLSGEPPRSLVEELLPSAPIASAPSSVPLGLPAELIRRRPDVRAAERQLAAATARIGEQVAELYPKFSLTGAFGMQSVDVRDLVDWRSRAFSVGPSVRWRLFEGARIGANIRIASARQQQAWTRYEQTVLIAMEEVESALVALERERVRYASLTAAVDANRRALELSNELYSKGLSSFLNVLESERSLYAAEDQQIQSQQTVVTNLVALHKALGGGWPADAPDARGPAEPRLIW